MASLAPTSLSKDPLLNGTLTIFGSKVISGEIQQTRLRSFRSNTGAKLKASAEPPALTQEIKGTKQESLLEMESGFDLFDEMKNREDLEHFQALSKGQVPKTLGCAPRTSWGFNQEKHSWFEMLQIWCPHLRVGHQKLMPHWSLLLNSLEVENILIIGHSCCGGIRALMSMQDEVDPSSFTRSWVIVGKNAKLSTKAAASNLSFDQQCTHCEKESINCSLLNLLTYPWIEEKVKKGVLSLHGGYYDFVDCTFEKWTMDYRGSIMDGKNTVVLKNRSFWC
ncbi:hypothetical protein DITRI_Ditri08aG0091600 [Diplodiscus trichospermus]